MSIVIQCAGLTSKKSQCKNKSKDKYCHLHKNQKVYLTSSAVWNTSIRHYLNEDIQDIISSYLTPHEDIISVHNDKMRQKTRNYLTHIDDIYHIAIHHNDKTKMLQEIYLYGGNRKLRRGEKVDMETHKGECAMLYFNDTCSNVVLDCDNDEAHHVEISYNKQKMELTFKYLDCENTRDDVFRNVIYKYDGNNFVQKHISYRTGNDFFPSPHDKVPLYKKILHVDPVYLSVIDHILRIPEYYLE